MSWKISFVREESRGSRCDFVSTRRRPVARYLHTLLPPSASDFSPRYRRNALFTFGQKSTLFFATRRDRSGKATGGLEWKARIWGKVFEFFVSIFRRVDMIFEVRSWSNFWIFEDLHLYCILNPDVMGLLDLDYLRGMNNLELHLSRLVNPDNLNLWGLVYIYHRGMKHSLDNLGVHFRSVFRNVFRKKIKK